MIEDETIELNDKYNLLINDVPYPKGSLRKLSEMKTTPERAESSPKVPKVKPIIFQSGKLTKVKE